MCTEGNKLQGNDTLDCSAQRQIGRLRFLELPTELLVDIFGMMEHEDLVELSTLFIGEASRQNGIYKVIQGVLYSHIIVTNYSRNSFYELEELQRIVPKYRINRYFFWPLEDIINRKIPLSYYVRLSKKVYYIFGNRESVYSIHKVMRQFSKYLNVVPPEFTIIPSEIYLFLNTSAYLETIDEFRRDFQELNIIFMNHVISHSASCRKLVRLCLNDGIYDYSSVQKLELSDISALSWLQTLELNNLHMQSDHNLQLPPGLLSLDLSNNNLTNIDNLNLPNKLKKLNLANNDINQVQRHLFPDSLEILDLANNRINTLIGNAFPDSIYELDLSCNYIEEINFLIPTELKYLNLKGCTIKDIRPDLLTIISNNSIKIYYD